MQKYLEASKYIDWKNQEILDKASQLALNARNEEAIVRSCFEFVRDEIKHSGDHMLNPVTCKASDVLKYGTGFCYAKSHLLAALLRANTIPAGLCYQRLTIKDDQPPFCLHGLNAVLLGWYRIDPRGNREGIESTFTPPIENLAYPIRSEGELDLPEIWAEPLAVVVGELESRKTYAEVIENLPDIQLVESRQPGRHADT